jgi:fructose-specific phosphotransferase system component IIB
MTYQNLPQNTEWDVKIETKAAAGATNATTCTLVIALDVQE